LVNVVFLFLYQHQAPGIYLFLIFNFEYGFHISKFYFKTHTGTGRLQ